ncbi:hypothetical protein [Brevifollis gellanilyticus]|uniref:Uncharacterized protein n=1 Tax=Brevifollis gellanilyticus TaxID=748831 RepID=A0A512M886_9BACT|nr:hypothetical protein [Brevifollis gellanilyticus]GEP42947.1 hypothetical protein BGE01nite_22380 [Brevifollis gellanilyticus]
MSTNPPTVKKPLPYAEVRRIFREARQQQLQTQGPITAQAIQEIQQSRKYAR